MADKEHLSVGNDIRALALINIRDIFQFTITAKDEEIIDRYGSEEMAVSVAEKYLDIALKAAILENPLKGWNMKYTMPEKGSDKRRDYTAYFYDSYNCRDDKENGDPDKWHYNASEEE